MGWLMEMGTNYHSIVTFLCNTVVFDGEELHASYYQSLLSQVRDMVDAL